LLDGSLAYSPCESMAHRCVVHEAGVSEFQIT
jgi:hypothetical protein